jgi:hypothetical protein
MGSDDKGKGAKETIAEEVKALAGKAYDDVAAPSAKAVGGTLGRLVRLALRPIELLAQGGERLMSRVERKLGGVPEDRLLSPPATIAAPAALHYALLGEGDEVAALREMFENLLVASMDRDTTSSVHPAFVSMISQLTPDEAWILKSIEPRRYVAFNLLETTALGTVTQSPLGFRSLMGLGTGIDESRQEQYLSNLERLGVLRIDWRHTLADHTEREELRRRVDAEFPTRSIAMDQGSISVTALGQQFLDTCVRARGPTGADR